MRFGERKYQKLMQLEGKEDATLSRDIETLSRDRVVKYSVFWCLQLWQVQSVQTVDCQVFKGLESSHCKCVRLSWRIHVTLCSQSRPNAKKAAWRNAVSLENSLVAGENNLKEMHRADNHYHYYFYFYLSWCENSNYYHYHYFFFKQRTSTTTPLPLLLHLEGNAMGGELPRCPLTDAPSLKLWFVNSVQAVCVQYIWFDSVQAS